MTIPFGENGGFTASTFYLMVPVQTSDLGLVYVGIFDVTSFNDPVDSSFYAYRMEDVVTCRVPTVRRVLLVYRDLGLATLTVSISGTDDNNNAVVGTVNVQIGTIAASGAQLTKLIDITVSAFRPQLAWSRAAGGGPISIISATMVGTAEDVTL
jgi:hypothetical protein